MSVKVIKRTQNHILQLFELIPTLDLHTKQGKAHLQKVERAWNDWLDMEDDRRISILDASGEPDSDLIDALRNLDRRRADATVRTLFFLDRCQQGDEAALSQAEFGPFLEVVKGAFQNEATQK